MQTVGMHRSPPIARLAGIVRAYDSRLAAKNRFTEFQQIPYSPLHSRATGHHDIKTVHATRYSLTTLVRPLRRHPQQPYDSGVPTRTMFPLVRLSLSLLRIATHATLFLEAQRVLLRLLRPTHPNTLARTEARVLSRVRSRCLHRWISDGCGNYLHVLEFPGREEHALPIVLVHGHSMSAAFWVRNVDDLVMLGYRVIAVDLLGWGRSQRPVFRGKTPDDVMQWYLPSLEGALRTMGLEDFVLVGHSLGAYFAMEYTKRNVKRVRHLVLVAPAASTREMSLKRALYFSLPPQAIVRRGGLVGFVCFCWYYPRRKSYIADRLREYTYHLASQRPSSGEEAVRPIIKLSWDGKAECRRPLIENLKRFDTPVRIIVGETDSSMPVESVHELYRHMRRKGFSVKMNVVQGADHCPQIEKPEEFLHIIAELGAPAKMLATEQGW